MAASEDRAQPQVAQANTALEGRAASRATQAMERFFMGGDTAVAVSVNKRKGWGPQRWAGLRPGGPMRACGRHRWPRLALNFRRTGEGGLSGSARPRAVTPAAGARACQAGWVERPSPVVGRRLRERAPIPDGTRGSRHVRPQGRPGLGSAKQAASRQRQRCRPAVLRPCHATRRRPAARRWGPGSSARWRAAQTTWPMGLTGIA